MFKDGSIMNGLRLILTAKEAARILVTHRYHNHSCPKKTSNNLCARAASVMGLEAGTIRGH